MSKKESYASISRKIEALIKKQEEEKKRMADIMSACLISDLSAMKLSQYSDAELRRIMTMIAEDIDVYIERFEAEKEEKRAQTDSEKRQYDAEQYAHQEDAGETNRYDYGSSNWHQ